MHEDAAPTNSISGGAIAAPDARAFGSPVVRVKDATYASLVKGKKKHSRWNKIDCCPEDKERMRKAYKKASRVLLQNSSGVMSYLKK